MKINQERLLDTFVKLVSIDSPSYQEREMCEELKKQLLAHSALRGCVRSYRKSLL